MALTRITKGVIKPNENYDTHNINSTGIITAIGGNITGNLSVGGVLTYEDVTSIDSVGIITAQQGIHVGAGISVVGVSTFNDGIHVGAGISVVGVSTFNDLVGFGTHITLQDNGEIRLGEKVSGGNRVGDFIIRHDPSLYGGAFNVIQSTNGNIQIENRDTAGPTRFLYLKSDSVQVRSYTGNESFIQCTRNQDVKLYYDNSEKLATTSSGISVTGTIVATGADINGDLDVDGHTELDNVRISGITTVTGDIRKPTGTYYPMLTIRSSAGAGSAALRIDNWSNGSTKRINISHNFNRLSSAFAADDSSIGCASVAFEDGEIRFGTSAAGTNNSQTRYKFDSSGHFLPNADSTYDIGTNSVRVRNVYADTLYGDGSNLTGIAADKIFEGNTEVETVDTGTDGHVKFTLEGSEKARIAGVGSFGLGVDAPVCSFDASSKSDALQVPNGTTAERPSGIATAHSYGMIRYNETFGLLEKYDSNGWSVIDNPPTVASFSGVLNQNNDTTLTITGTNFKAGAVVAIEGAAVSNSSRALTTTFVSSTSLTAPTNAASVNYVDNASFNIKVTNPGGLVSLLENAGTVDSTLTWTTSAGSLGTWNDTGSYSVTVAATDPDSTAVTYAVTSGSLPPNTTLNTSSGVISTNGLGSLGSSTTYSFTITATSNSIGVARAFTITGQPAPDGSTSSRGTTPDFLRNTLGVTTDGNYWIKTTGMSSAVQCYINFGMLDGKDWLLMARWSGVSGGNSPWGAAINAQNENDHVGKDIPFKGFSFDNNGSHTYSYFSSYSPYNIRRVGTNNGSTTSSGGNKGGYRLYIGVSGGMGWYGTQTHNSCNWQNSSGMVGAGYNNTCGNYPGSLQFGTGRGDPFMGSFFSGTLRMWIWMDNKQPIA